MVVSRHHHGDAARAFRTKVERRFAGTIGGSVLVVIGTLRQTDHRRVDRRALVQNGDCNRGRS